MWWKSKTADQREQRLVWLIAGVVAIVAVFSVLAAWVALH
jgi:uncharacterized membrane protein